MSKKRKSGDGTVRLRKEGRWEGRVVVGYDDKGYPKTKNVLAKAKRECVEKLNALKAQLAPAQTDKLAADMPFGDWLDYWYQNCVKDTIRPSTQQGYENSIYRHIIPALGALPLNKVTQGDLQRFLIQAKYEGYYELFLLELATGLRRGELLALQWSDLDLDTGELRVNRQINRVRGKLTTSEPKTRASLRTILLPESVTAVLRSYKPTVYSRWLFPSPVNEDVPRDPSSVRKILQRVLEHAECKQVRFHDLRHTFITTSLEHGMDVKTLSAIVGHVSAAITLDVYTHVTTEMQKNAAARIDRGIAKNKRRKPTPEASESRMTGFEAREGKHRRPGTGCVTQLDAHLWEGRYTPTYPDGKRHPRNVYAHSEEECEEKLARLIAEMKAEIAALRAKERWQRVSC